MKNTRNACSSVARRQSSGPNENDSMVEILNGFRGTEEKLTSSVLDYWKKQKQLRPQLYKVASVVFAIPPVQCTIEQAFSSLPIILTSHRTRLSNESFQNIMLVRLNYNFYKESSHI